MPGSNILHIAGIRIRVVGSGNLDLEFQGYDDVITQTLVPIAMTSTSFKERTRLANFQGQASKLKFSINEENETFRINHIWIYVKPIWTDYPSVD